MTVAMRPDILSCLQSMRQDVERRIASLDRFRALKAIEQTIADFPGLDDLTRSLSDIRDQVSAQLDETREFRALRSIERIVPELSEVIALMEYAPALEERTAAPPAAEPAGAASEDSEPIAANEGGPDASGFELTASGPTNETGTPAQPVPVDTERAGDESVDVSYAAMEEGAETHHQLARSGTIVSGADAEAIPSLADSVAQLMAQSMSPQREGHAPPPPHPQERSDGALTQAERAA